MGDPPHFRRSRRQPLSLRVRFRRAEAGSTLEHMGSLSDLSVEGAFIATDRPPAEGERVEVVLSAPTAWDPIRVSGTVRWVSEGVGGEERGFGVRFDSLGPQEASALHELVHASAYADSPE